MSPRVPALRPARGSCVHHRVDTAHRTPTEKHGNRERALGNGLRHLRRHFGVYRSDRYGSLPFLFFISFFWELIFIVLFKNEQQIENKILKTLVFTPGDWEVPIDATKLG